MANPKAYLPASIPEAAIHALLSSLSVPQPSQITPLSASASYHRIYILTYSSSTISRLLPDPPPNSSLTSVILRISGLHFPGIKTLNEWAVHNWLTTHTKIPVPRILHYDASRDNALGYEYTLMSRALGQSFDLVKAELSSTSSSSEIEEHLEGFVQQIVDIISELQSHSWGQIGGLQEVPPGLSSTESQLRGTEEIDVVEGFVVDENMWQVPELDLFWGEGKETFHSLNIKGPFPSYVSFLTTQAEKYIYAIQRHSSLSSFRSLIPQIEAFMAAMEQHQEELNQTHLVLAHRDLHLGNIMYEVSTRQITAVLDWEFAGVVPAQRWDPQRAFMWSGDENNGEEKAVLRQRVEQACRERGIPFFEDVKYKGKRQEHMQLAMNFLRAIVEVMPRGQVDKPVETWKESMLVHMNAVCAD